MSTTIKKDIKFLASEDMQVDFMWLKETLSECDIQLNGKDTSPRVMIARALKFYVKHVEGLVADVNASDKGDFEGRADARYEGMLIKKATAALEKPKVPLHLLERHGVLADGKIHTIDELGKLFTQPVRKDDYRMPNFLLTEEERAAKHKSKRKRKQHTPSYNVDHLS